MSNLLDKVKNQSSHSYKVRKIEEILLLFGGRQAKSHDQFIPLWDKVKDQRKEKTWPISREGEEMMEREGLIKKFTADDAFFL